MRVRRSAYDIRSQVPFKIIFFQDELICKLAFSGGKSTSFGLSRNYSLVWLRDREWETSHNISVQFSRSVVSDSVALWTAARQASLSITNSQSLPKLMSTESVMPSNHLILCRPLLLLSPIPPSIRVFLMSQFFASGGQSIGVSASTSVLPMNTQD